MAISRKAVIFGCTHVPHHCEDYKSWLLSLIDAERPDDIVHLGDLFEGDAASRWKHAEEEGDHPLEDEFASANQYLGDIRKHARGARLRFVRGNHDVNLTGRGRIPADVRSLCDPFRKGNVPELEHWLAPTEYICCRKRGSLALSPQIVLSHGFATSPREIEREAVYMTANRPNALYVTAHTHRPQPVTQITLGAGTKALPLSAWSANVGTGRDIVNTDYMDRQARWNWGQAAMVCEYSPLKSPRVTSREWGAEVRVFRMYDDAVVAA